MERSLFALLIATFSIYVLDVPDTLAQDTASPASDPPLAGRPGTTGSPASPLSSSLAACLADLRPQARAKGVSQGTLERAFSDVSPDPDVLAAARRQPEFVKPIWDYLDAAVSDGRIATGQAKLAEWAQVLEAIEKRYGVDRHIVLAIWGMESSYGAVLDDPQVVKPVIRSLATLACGDPDRAHFWREQLLAALQLLERGDVAPDRMTGSWAGAMGHTQFMPTTYQAHAVDFDQDGRRDLWSSVPDALASTANYLKVSGWRAGETWGYEVELPQGFDFALADGTTHRPVSEWMRLGVRAAQEPAVRRADANAALMLPAGPVAQPFCSCRTSTSSCATTTPRPMRWRSGTSRTASEAAAPSSGPGLGMTGRLRSASAASCRCCSPVAASTPGLMMADSARRPGRRCAHISAPPVSRPTAIRTLFFSNG